MTGRIFQAFQAPLLLVSASAMPKLLAYQPFYRIAALFFTTCKMVYPVPLRFRKIIPTSVVVSFDLLAT
jgi:hypothetical protein